MTAVAVLVSVQVVILAPVIPTQYVSGATPPLPSAVLQCLKTQQCLKTGNVPLGIGVQRDPSGTYLMYSVNETTCNVTTCYQAVAMNLTSFERLQVDPYSSHLLDVNCTSSIQGGIIFVMCPQPRCQVLITNLPGGVGGVACNSVTPAKSQFDSVAYWLFHYGIAYSGGSYYWG